MSSDGDNRAQLQIGGQAVIEGVVMRGPGQWALAVRRPCGEIFLSVKPSATLAQRFPRLNVFPLRGIFALGDSLAIGIRSLSMSGAISLEELEGEEGCGPAGAEGGDPSDPSGNGPGLATAPPRAGAPDPEGGAAPDGEAEGGRGSAEADRAAERAAGMPKAAIAMSMLMALGLFLGLFFVLPAVIASKFDDLISSTVAYNLAEGSIRILIFVGYLLVMSLLPDIRRVFQYHGAEHKVVHAYEKGKMLTAEEASEFSTAHMRCGTAFILIVMVLSILVFSLLGRPALWLRVLERLAIIPLVAAFSYEIIRFAGRHEESILVKIIMSPGLLLQRLTTREPDDRQLEVAAAALRAAVGEAAGAPAGGEDETREAPLPAG